MAFPLKLFLGLIGLISATVLAAVLYVSVIFDPNDYRDEINQAVAENTGRELSIDGDIDLNLFPWIGVSVNTLALSNAADFGPEPMLEIGELEARLELMPLLTERMVRIGEVRLLDVAIRAATHGDKNNWDDLVESETTDDSLDNEEEALDHEIIIESSNPQDEGADFDLAIAGITLKNIRVEYEQDGELTELQLDTLQTGPIRLGESSTLLLELSASLPDNLSVTTELRSEWSVDPEGPIAQLDNLRLSATVTGPSVPGGKQTVQADGSASYDGNSGKASIPALTLTSGELQATLQADIRVEEAGPQGNIALKTNRFVAQNVAAGLGIPLGTEESSPGPTELDFEFSVRPDAIRSSRLQGTLDGADLNGTVAIENFSQPRIRSNLTLASFTLENWTPPTSESEAPAATKDEDASQDPMDSELPLELVKDLDLDITAKIGQFQGMGVQARNVLWTAFARPGQPFRQELSMNAYGGEIRMKNNVDARGAQPKTGMQLNLEAVGLGDLLKGTVGEAYVTGLTQLSLDLNTAGNTLKSMIAAAVGSAQYSLKDGSVEGFSLLDLINTSAAKLSGGQAQDSGENKTSFEELAGQLVFSGGRANAQKLSADSKLMAVNGKGGFDLENLRWDLDLIPRLKDHPEISQHKHLKKLVGLDIPVSVTGPFTSPKFKLDVEGTLKARAQQEIDKKKDELKSKAEDKAKKEFGRQLNRWFGSKKSNESTQQEGTPE